jgi:tellurite resistance protein TerA
MIPTAGMCLVTHITKGANTPVPAGLLRVAVCRRNVPGTPAVDASALLLDAVGKVRGDADLVFYNQPAHPSGPYGTRETPRATDSSPNGWS